MLLHEGLGSVAMWRDFPDALAGRTGRRVFAYSRFGHGQSDPPARPRTPAFMDEEARLLAEILDTAGIARAVLFGHSDGGSIALLAAADLPARVHSLVLEAPHVFVEDVSLASIARMQRLYADADTALRARLQRYHRDVDAAFRGWNDVWLDPAFRAWNIEAALPRVSCPVLAMQGELDEYGTLAQIDAIVRQASGPVTRLVLDNAGHAPHRDAQAAVLDAIETFLSAQG